jgi:hypothetical protein
MVLAMLSLQVKLGQECPFHAVGGCRLFIAVSSSGPDRPIAVVGLDGGRFGVSGSHTSSYFGLNGEPG